MKALTLPQPIPECVLRHGQRFLRRDVAPEPELLGERIALHAGEYADGYHATHRHPSATYLELDLPLALPKLSIVATARVRGFFVAESAARGGQEWHPPFEDDVDGALVQHGGVRADDIFRLRDLREEALASPWWTLSDAFAPIDVRDRGRSFVAGAVYAFGWLLDDVREVDPPVSAVRPLRSPVGRDGTWELGRVAVREVQLREEQVRCA